MVGSTQMYSQSVPAICIDPHSIHDSDIIELFLAHLHSGSIQITIQCNWPLCELLLETHLVPSADCSLIQYS